MLQPGTDYDPEIDLDEYGLSEQDRKTLGEILLSKGSGAVKAALEKHFGASFSDIQREAEESKRYEAKVEKMTEALKRFQLHFPLWLNTERNQKTLLAFLKENGLREFNYRILAAMYEELAGVDGALDLDETKPANARLYVGQRVPGQDLDKDYLPRKAVSAMSADEFTKAIIRSPKFRQMVDGTER